MAVPAWLVSKATASMACIPACMHMNQRRFVLLVGGRPGAAGAGLWNLAGGGAKSRFCRRAHELPDALPLR